MPYFALIYEVVDDFPARRAPFREEHLLYAREVQSRGELIFGGALTDPADRAVIIFCAENKTVVEHFAPHDAYVTNGIVKHWAIRLWNVVVGNEVEIPNAQKVS